MKRSIAFDSILINCSIFTPGSMSWKSGWLQFEEPSMQGDVSELLQKANHLIQSADTKEELLKLIDTYEKALKIEPKNRESLAGAALYSFLMAVAYSDTKDEKRSYSLKTIKHNEQLMYLNYKFANLVDKGESLWEASRVLSKNEIDALFFYYFGIGTLWRECLSVPEKIINLNWTSRMKKILKAMMEIDPTWEGGSLYYAWANYYAAAPRIAGGDVKKAEEYYKKAIELGPEMLNFRRTRALLLHTKNKDRAAFEKDLNWVLSQDPNKVRRYFTYPFSVFVQRDARYMLDHIDNYFN
jgi:tetratricopeptide (TPR) repeat protein